MILAVVQNDDLYAEDHYSLFLRPCCQDPYLNPTQTAEWQNSENRAGNAICTPDALWSQDVLVLSITPTGHSQTRYRDKFSQY